MKTRRRIDLIRHAESENNAVRIYVGGRTIDHALSEKGECQANLLGIDYGPLPVDVQLLSSPAERAVRTAKLAFPSKSLELDGRLLETDRGIHESMLLSEVYDEEFLRKQLAEGFDHKSPGGESMNEAADRLQDLLDELDAGSVSVAISHSRIIKALLARLESFSYQDTRDRSIIDIRNTSVTRFENAGRGWRVPFFGRSALEVAIDDRRQGKRSA